MKTIPFTKEPRAWLRFIAFGALLFLAASLPGRAAPVVSHPPLRHPVAMANRLMGTGPAFYVDPLKGSDRNDGTSGKPWKTVQASLEKLRPGDTLYLAGGVYFENLYCAISGTAEAPITIRSKPGELAIIDGGIPEFETNPAGAWEPAPGGAPDEYRSTRAYPNLRDVVGLFADSNLGLQTYWHPEDLRSQNEVASGDPMKQERGQDVIWSGPGIWYNRVTGRIHVRLAHTHLEHPRVSNYRGETDPRKLPLVIAPYMSTPLYVDLGRHLRFQDLVFRGGGVNNVRLVFGMDLEFDHVTIFGGTYGMRAKNTGPVKFLNSAIYGGIPPWGFLNENALHIYTPTYTDPYSSVTGTGRSRNVARLTAHALLVMEGFEESDVFAYPFNNRWEIAYSEFADGHDGVYPNGTNIRFHDNWVGNMQDDGIYLSSPTRRVCDDVHIYRNYINGCTTAFAFHGRGGPEGSIYIYGNVVDMRGKSRGWWRSKNLKELTPYPGNFFLVHGSGGMLAIESIYFYHNTAVVDGNFPMYLGAAWGGVVPPSSRHVMNNLFVYLNQYPGAGINLIKGSEAKTVIDGNVHWSPDKEAPADWLKTVQAGGWEQHSVVGSPAFLAFSENPTATNDYRIGNGVAVGRATSVPAGVKLEDGVGGRDVGAYQTGSPPRKVGVDGRILVGTPAR
ncbi:MAG: hypothetical protein IT578_00590 [Verrucomicrobiae bacterium]|nr:hypothetical protein [Verrucomicrobiae bacterium]